VVVGVLTTSYPRHAGDYAGSFVADRVRALQAAGHEVEVVAAGADGPAAVEKIEEGARVTRIPCGGGLFYGGGAPEALEHGQVAPWLAAVRFTTALSTATRARRSGWHRIEAHWLVPCALAAAAAAPGLPRVGYAHSGDVALLERLPFGRAIARRLAADTTLRFVSVELRARFSALAGLVAPIGTVEPMIVPPIFFRRGGPDPELRRALGLRGPTVLAVGRLVPIKGHDRLLGACARAAAAGAGPIELVILGDGPGRAQLDRRARTLGLSLRLPGFVARAEVARWLRAADLFAHSSVRLPNGRGEGAPVAEREARAVGIPVVAGDDPAVLAAAIVTALGQSVGNPCRESVASV
jgi:glycosyltransferase involved in cell wall biosynthesis